MQALTTVPFTSISQAPQLPPRHPVGMDTPAFAAAESQSLPTGAVVVMPPGQWMEIGSAAIDGRPSPHFPGWIADREPLSGIQQRPQIDMLFEGIRESIQQLMAVLGVMGSLRRQLR